MAKSRKINKWDAAPENIGKVKHDLGVLERILTFLLDRLKVQTYDVDDSEYKELVDDIFKSLDKALDDYNELEAKHNADCGLISEYEEENRNLKSELDIMTDENDCLIARVFKQDEEYQKLEATRKRLQETDEFHQKIHRKVQDEYAKIAAENAELRSQCESKDDGLQKMIKEVAELEKEKIDLEVQLAQSDELRYRSAKYAWAIKTVLKKASFSPGHIAEELRFMAKKSTTPKDVQERWETYANEFLGEHSKFVDEINRLEKKIETLEKENKDLKDTLEKNEGFGRYVGERVADSIREGCDKGVYELHPCTRIDIHVYETNNMPMFYARHAIPRIAVMFNNTQTEMERDTAEHECEELNRKVDTVWRANDELNRKIKGLEKENKDLKQILAMCERDANMARNLCHTIAFNAERARNNKEEK